MTTTYDIYYDEEGDFLEVSFGEPPEEEETEEVEPGIFVTRSTRGRVTSVGVLAFKNRVHGIARILASVGLAIPLDILPKRAQ